MKTILSILLLLLVGAPSLHAASNIDLSTVPERNTVQLTIYNSEDLTLVRETRQIVFKPGQNRLQFSWANTLIDPTSVQLEFKDHAESLTLTETAFPHDKPQMLYWDVQSEMNGPATVEISYFTSGISWSADYTCIASPNEQTMAIEGYVRVQNNSGEDYENAQVRLVVGTINLVQPIRQLAQQGMGEEQAQRVRRAQLRGVMEDGKAEVMSFAAGRAVDAATEPKQVAKQGLSEYFIFTIEGRETVPNGWAKRLRSFQADNADMRVQYRYRQREYGPQLVRMYLLKNDQDSGMGNAPLPDGIYRIFQRTGQDGLKYLAQQHRKYIPAGDKIELNLGVDPNVVFELKQLAATRDQFLMQWKNSEWLFEPGKPAMRIEPNSDVVGWRENQSFAREIFNTTDRPIQVQVRRSFSGAVTFISELNATTHDVNTVQYTVTLQPGEKRNVRYELRTLNGKLAKQQRVTVEQAQPTPVQFVRKD